MTKNINIPQVEKQFKGEGIRLVFAQNEAEVLQHLKGAETFLVFIGMDFAENGIRVMQRNISQTTAYWVMITGNLTTQKRSALLQAGAMDLLSLPVNAAQFKLRAKGLLARYLKNFDMPEEVVLPEGFLRRSSGQVQRGTAEGAGEGPGRMYDNLPGSGENQSREYNHLRGGPEAAAPENRIHDLSADPNTGGVVNHIRSEDVAAKQGTLQRGVLEENKVQYGNIRSDDAEANAARLARGTMTENKAQHRNLVGADAEKNTGSIARGTMDESKPAHNNLVSADAPKSHGSVTVAPSPDELKRALDKNAARKAQSPNGLQSFAATETAPGQNNLVRGDMRDGGFPRVVNVGESTWESMGADPASLLESIRRKLVLLRSDTPWDPSIWVDYSKLLSGPFKGMDRTLSEMQTLFKDACRVLGAKRLCLVSLRAAPDTSTCPENVFCLVSSEDDPRNNESIATEIMPHLQVAFENQKPFVLDTKLPDKIANQDRPKSWKINGSVEKMSAVIPIMNGSQVGVALFIQFDSGGFNENTAALLEQAVTYLKVPERQYGMIDFLSRIYREAGSNNKV